jgi:hypothetical protein
LVPSLVKDSWEDQVGRQIALDTALGRHINNEQSEEITLWDASQYADLET